MLRLSKKADYALLALRYLAGERTGVASTRTISERFHIPSELLAKILQQLARNGLVAADRGVHGGYHLARPADAISIADVVQTIDGPITLTACSAVDVECDQYASCTVRDPLWRIRERILSVLQNMTLADMDEAARVSVPLTIRREDPGTGVPAPKQ
jgi:Rrf2 family protein